MGMADTGFPVLVKESVEGGGRMFAGMRVVGFLGMNELEHALCECLTDFELEFKKGKMNCKC